MSLDTAYTGQKFKSVGTRPVRPDGIDKVTGRARYGADYNMPGQLTARGPCRSWTTSRSNAGSAGRPR